MYYAYLKGGAEFKFGNKADPDKMFRLVDLNKDGSITFDEFSSMFG